MSSADALLAVAFWKAPDTWPLEPPGYVFLGAALQQVGRTLYRESWTGNEFVSVHVPQVLPPWPQFGAEPRSDAAREARNTIIIRDPQYRLPLLGCMAQVQVSSAPPPPRSLADFRGGRSTEAQPTERPVAADDAGARPTTREAYEHARELRQTWIAEAAASLNRARDVERRLSLAALQGHLRVIWRSNVDGALFETPAEWWGLDNRLPRYQSCRINWKVPAAAPALIDPWLFVDQAGFANLLASLSAPSETWRPGKGETLTHWSSIDGPADAAARERLRLAGNAYPLEAHICEELAAMWNLTAVERGVKPTNKKSVAQLRTR